MNAGVQIIMKSGWKYLDAVGRLVPRVYATHFKSVNKLLLILVTLVQTKKTSKSFISFG